MEVAATPQSYTILRIKRKRNEEPLDALVIESRVRRKKSRGGIGVFQFAQTVEYDAWADEKRQKDIQEQVSRLARESAAKAELAPSSIAPTEAPAPSISRPLKDEAHPRYTVLQQEDSEDAQKRRLPTSPPKVIPAKDLPPKTLLPDFKMFDAVLSANKSKAAPVDTEMENFLPMLQDYLKLHDITPEPPSNRGSASTKGAPASVPPPASNVDDYVWDVFYHRPATLSEWNVAANVATLTGLPPSITDPYDSASDSEEEDEADEDSNAEEYYKNDYPEEEDPSSEESDSDEFHEHSDHDDLMSYDDDGDDHEWR